LKILPEWKANKDEFLSLLLDADFEACLTLSTEIVQSPDHLKDFYLQIIQPSLYDVGLLWESGRVSVAEEHLATSIVGRIIASMYTRFRRGKYSKGTAVLTAAPNEFHEVGSRMVADLLEMDGWNVIYLGVNTPEDDLIRFIKKTKPVFVGISAAMPFNLDRISRIIADLRKDEETSRIRIMVGGIGFNSFPDLWRAVGADAWAPDGQQAVELAQKWAA
jgi:MerR family transcriptional regulator, light-induced transcriptional regulator